MSNPVDKLSDLRNHTPEGAIPLLALRILVVDDDTMIGMLLGAMLEAMGHSVCAIGITQRDAVNLAGEHKPDLMIVDAWLGAGSGVAAVVEILQSGFIPHVFMSGNIAKVRRLRPDAVVLEKPFKEPALVYAIQNALTIPSAA